MTIFLDTNILIDFILERGGFYTPAASIISYAAEKKADISVSSLTMVNANYICVERCKMPIETYRRKIDFLRTFMKVLDVDASDIYGSYDSQWKDFEDGVQYHCALRNKSDFIVTRNANDFESKSLPILSPDEILEIIETEISQE